MDRSILGLLDDGELRVDFITTRHGPMRRYVHDRTGVKMEGPPSQDQRPALILKIFEKAYLYPGAASLPSQAIQLVETIRASSDAGLAAFAGSDDVEVLLLLVAGCCSRAIPPPVELWGNPLASSNPLLNEVLRFVERNQPRSEP